MTKGDKRELRERKNRTEKLRIMQVITLNGERKKNKAERRKVEERVR